VKELLPNYADVPIMDEAAVRGVARLFQERNEPQMNADEHRSEEKSN